MEETVTFKWGNKNDLPDNHSPGVIYVAKIADTSIGEIYIDDENTRRQIVDPTALTYEINNNETISSLKPSAFVMKQLPAASSFYRGCFVLLEDELGFDSVYICKKMGESSYAWLQLDKTNAVGEV